MSMNGTGATSPVRDTLPADDERSAVDEARETELQHVGSPHLHQTIRIARMLELDVWPALFDQLTQKV